ncbi:SRPBCC domain-containing protein [Staphylococcus sp. 17KM0847]|uniref:SRPBCC family protein n=1 Tax=Staphylococcus sp. 17KM0847 TaxID=2583989 RepID=UPI0015DD12BA|nr:SRPBCC domain-containing protein [Staphylococcus sp. 17KM0847]QLK86684.1 SRPBCC domain-containing protein [Staphylococcus sp. 17KM0847]
MQNEWVEIEITRLMKATPADVYAAWIDPEQLREWFMTSPRTNVSVHSDGVEGGAYKVIDAAQGKKREVVGVYETLIPDRHIRKTIQMPSISEEADYIDVDLSERNVRLTEMTFKYKSFIPKERGTSNMAYKQKKKAYHDHTVHGFEMMFDTLQAHLEKDANI